MITLNLSEKEANVLIDVMYDSKQYRNVESHDILRELIYKLETTQEEPA